VLHVYLVVNAVGLNVEFASRLINRVKKITLG
jgi:hypothetical protein